MSFHFDVVVVGAGPGGMAAAAVAAEAGSRVCLLDDNCAPGGQIWRGVSARTSRPSPHSRKFDQWSSRLAQTGCHVWSGWQVIEAFPTNRLRVQRSSVLSGQSLQARDLAYDQLILATGARERFLPFPGWTLPGVMGVGGLQALVKSGLDPTGKRIVLAGSGPLLLAVGANLQSAGAQLMGIFEQAPLSRLAGLAFSLLRHPDKLAEGARYRVGLLHSPYRTGTWIVRADGQRHVEQVTLTDGSRQWNLACDWLGCGFHLTPNLELPSLLGCHQVSSSIRKEGPSIEVDRLQRTSLPNVFCVGELTGVGGLDKALVEGQIAGLAAAGRTAQALALEPHRSRQHSFADKLDRAFALRTELRSLPEEATIVCRCEDVPYAALKACSSARDAKLHTRCGMGACQGRICGSANEFLFGWDATSIRPPIFPASVSTLLPDTIPDTTPAN